MTDQMYDLLSRLRETLPAPISMCRDAITAANGDLSCAHDIVVQKLTAAVIHLTFDTSWCGNSAFSKCSRQTSVTLRMSTSERARSPEVTCRFGLLIGCDGHLQEFENLLLTGGEFRGKDDGLITRCDFVSFHIPKESDDIEDGRRVTRSALWIDGNGSDSLVPHGAANRSFD